MRAVCRAVHPDYHAHRYPHTQDYRDYVASGRPIRIIRIRLAPGEGYVAPTEHLLHDGSTEAQDQPSAAAFWLGHWPRGILPPHPTSRADAFRGTQTDSKATR